MRHIRSAKPCRRFYEGVENGRQVKCRAANGLEHVRRPGLLPEGFAKLIEQSRVLDSDDGLVGKILEQRDLIVGKRPHLLAVDIDHAEEFFIATQRNRQ